MESGFGQNLEGFLIKGNLSLLQGDIPALQGDGSIEGSGTLYINNIREYDVSNGITIQDVLLKNQQITVPYTQPSLGPTAASFIIDGGISIKTTTNSTSITSGGGLTIAGGASIAKNVNVGGVLDVNNNRITSVLWPILGTDGANKDYVDSKTFGNLLGNFTAGQVIVGDTGGNIIGYESFKFDGDKLTLNTPIVINDTRGALNLTAASLITLGGVSIGQNVIIGGGLDMLGTSIANVATPINPNDAATKAYVDNQTGVGGNFTTGQVIIAASNGDAIRGYSNLTFDGTSLVIASTENIVGSGGGAIVNYGGLSVQKNVYIGGVLDVNNNLIRNVQSPIASTDAANKEYVDNKTYGSLLGNFGEFELVTGSSDANTLISHPNFRFDGTTMLLGTNANLYISNTSPATGLGSGGALTISGGVSFSKDVYIGGKLDVAMNNIKQVASPVEDYDAVNKAYLDSRFNDENFLTLVNDTTIPIDIADFVVAPDVRAFLSYVYVQYNQENCAIFTLRGINRGSNWYLQKTFVGEPSNVDFFIRYDNGTGILQYTNTNVTGNASIRYITLTEIQDSPNQNQINVDIANNVTSYQSIPELTFLNSDYDAVKIIMYVSNDSANKYGMVFLNCLLKGNDWIMTPHSFGNVTGLHFTLLTSPTDGTVQYTNTNNTGQYTLRINVIPILKSQPSLSLAANTNVFTDISSTELIFDNSQSIFQITAFVTVPGLNKHALYEFDGVHCDGVWSLNARYIGDITGLRFSLETLGNLGVLRFINTNPSIAYIRYVLDAPLMFDSLPVKRGGSGHTYLTPHAVLRGNGIDPILASNDFVYKDLELKLGPNSTMLLTNTSTESFNSHGGIVIEGPLRVKNIDMTPSIGDLFTEQLFLASNNVNDQDVVGFSLTHPSVKSFNGTACVSVKTTTNEYDAMFDIKALRKATGWIVQAPYFGDVVGVTFSIATNGQIQYTSTYISDWIETRIKYRGLTTTIL